MDEETTEVMQMSAVESMERVQVDMQIATAKKYPRDIATVKRDIITMATMDEDTAMACFYSLPRGGKRIQGPSVRLAEIALSCYGNARVQTRVIEVVTDGDNKHVVVQATCADLQNNIAVCMEKRRAIYGKKKNNYKPQEDDVSLAANACAAIAFRDAVYKVVPGALIKPALNEAIKVATGDGKTFEARVDTALEHFNNMGLDEKRVLHGIGKTHKEQIALGDLEDLFGMFNAIKEGHSTIESLFPKINIKPMAHMDGKTERNVAVQAAKEAGIDAIDDSLTTAEIYATIRKLTQKQETKPEVKPAQEEKVEKKAEPAKTTTKADEKATRLKTLEAMSMKLDQADLALTCNGLLDKHTAVERASYCKICGIEYGADLNIADMESLRKLYVMLEAEKQQKSKQSEAKEGDTTEELSFA